MFVHYHSMQHGWDIFNLEGEVFSDDFSQASSGLGSGRARQVGGKGSWSQEGRWDVSNSTTHLTHQKPRRPGATRRAGNP